MSRRRAIATKALINVADHLGEVCGGMGFEAPVTHVYNPVNYARRPHVAYLKRFGAPPKEVLLVGMNPGPWGMAQTGVPFGAIPWVREWMGIDEPVVQPEHPHPKRPVEGFECARTEVSGDRLWGWAAARFGTAEAFFERFFVWNYCPLSFMEATGRNRTPDKLPVAEREPLFAACDGALRGVVELLQPRLALGVGKFAEGRLKAALAALPDAQRPRIGTILHPSPASPKANQGWAEQAEAQLVEWGVELP